MIFLLPKNGESTAQFDVKEQEGSKPSGKCDTKSKTASFAILTEQGWKLAFQYVRDSNKYNISSISLIYTVNATNFPEVAEGVNQTHKISIGNLTLLPTPIGKGCNYQPKIEFSIDSNVAIEIESYNTRVFTKSTPLPGKFWILDLGLNLFN